MCVQVRKSGMLAQIGCDKWMEGFSGSICKRKCCENMEMTPSRINVYVEILRSVSCLNVRNMGYIRMHQRGGGGIEKWVIKWVDKIHGQSVEQKLKTEE